MVPVPTRGDWPETGSEYLAVNHCPRDAPRCRYVWWCARQVELRIANEKYLREHPELSKVLSACVDHLLTTRPADVIGATKEFFVTEAAAKALASR